MTELTITTILTLLDGFDNSSRPWAEVLDSSPSDEKGRFNTDGGGRSLKEGWHIHTFLMKHCFVSRYCLPFCLPLASGLSYSQLEGKEETGLVMPLLFDNEVKPVIEPLYMYNSPVSMVVQGGCVREVCTYREGGEAYTGWYSSSPSLPGWVYQAPPPPFNSL